MPRFLVRASVEYSIVVEADSPAHAETLAEWTPYEDWDSCCSSELESELIESEDDSE